MSSTPPGQQAGIGQDQVITDLIEILRKGSLIILLFPSRGSKETSLTVTLSFSSSCRMTISLQGQQDFQKHVVKPPEPRLLLINIVC